MAFYASIWNTSRKACRYIFSKRVIGMQKEKKQNPVGLFLKNNFNRDILLYGGVEWTFWAIFATLAFTTAHLAQVGFSSKTTGVIMALVSVAGIVASPIVGNLSDKIGSARSSA